MSFVLDSSAAMAWIYPEERTDAVRDLIRQIPNGRVWVPLLWYVEVGNVLQTGLRRGRIDLAFRDRSLADLAVWNLQVDMQIVGRAWIDAVRLSDRHRLTLYDAVYMELALRRGLPLATLDKALRRAAETENITLLSL